MIKFIVLIPFFISLISCGTFKGPGDYKTSSDYNYDGDSREYYLSDHKNIPNHVPRGEFKLYWPVSSVKINRGFRPGSDPNHEGVDLGGPRGTPILAAHEGVVIYAGRGFKGYGKMVMIEYDSNWATLYAHLDKIKVKEGGVVTAGTHIGSMGKSGRATGVHLHFELIFQKKTVDPIPILTNGTKVALLTDFKPQE